MNHSCCRITGCGSMLLLGGIDEVGRGPLAGPVTAAAVILPPGYRNPQVTDSKKLTEEAREELFAELTSVALCYSIRSLGPAAIDRYNILEASRRVMAACAKEVVALLNSVGIRANIHFLVDGNVRIATRLSHEPIIDGDEKLAAISAASILAKVTRDRLMVKMDKRYPGYGFASHKGYATEFHRQKIRELGPSKIHRASFSGVREFLPLFAAAR